LREIVILLLVVALVVLVIGAVNQDQSVDLDYVFGTWEDVSVLTLSAVAAGAAVVLGLIIGAMARLRVVSDRRKLERELNLVYPRLREAERAAGLPAWSPPVEGRAMLPGSVGTSGGESEPPAGTEAEPGPVTAAQQEPPAGDRDGAGQVSAAPLDGGDAGEEAGAEPARPAGSPAAAGSAEESGSGPAQPAVSRETTGPAAGRDDA
jgi:uncharacterized membrane protein YciS (DUF1049 family)